MFSELYWYTSIRWYILESSNLKLRIVIFFLLIYIIESFRDSISRIVTMSFNCKSRFSYSRCYEIDTYSYLGKN